MSSLKDTSPINFVENISHYLSPFSAHRILYNNQEYMTVEHAYQASKFSDADAKEQIMNSPSAYAAWQTAQKLKQNKDLLNENFDKLVVMEKLMRLKIQQHQDVQEALLATENRGLLKVYPTDYFWGTGADGTGNNYMGKLWMKIREEIR